MSMLSSTYAAPDVSARVRAVRDRLPIYQIGAAVVEVARALVPVVEKHAHDAIADYADRVIRDFPEASQQMASVRDQFVRAGAVHWIALFSARFDEAFLASQDAFAECEALAAVGARSRPSVAMRLIPRLLAERAKRTWQVSRFGTDCDAIFRLVMFDITTAIALDQRKRFEASEARRVEILGDMAQFQQSISALAGDFSRDASDLTSTATSSTMLASTNRDGAVKVLEACDLTREVTTATASSTQELSQSIRAISGNVHRTNETVVVAAEATRSLMLALADLKSLTSRVSGMVGNISGIASHTDLLALNATIEAARAGEAGRGFAVVASAVKALAHQTGTVTVEIGAEIQSLNRSMAQCEDLLSSLSSAIDQVSAGAVSIAAAVDQQDRATSSIAEDAAKAASAFKSVEAISAASVDAADRMIESAEVLRRASGTLVARSGKLEETTARFLAAVERSSTR
jgi:methyl-accepting chemotaxis protein